MIDAASTAPTDGHPFYIVSPSYDEASAGNRVLHRLALELTALGHEAYLTPHPDYADAGIAPTANLSVPYLTRARAASHFEAGRTPVVVYPEVTRRLQEGGVRVFYLLNYVGFMGGPKTVPACEMVVAYAETIARSAPRCDGVLFIPVSDPQFWTPTENARRTITIAYAGKFLDVHGESLPADLHVDETITRHRPDSPTRTQIRSLFRHARRLHVFENTALITEALLCGCPVTPHFSTSFPEMIARLELGDGGLIADGDKAAALNADAGVALHRERYMRQWTRTRERVAAFADLALATARTTTYTTPFVVAGVDRPPPPAIPDRPELSLCGTEDVAYAYWLTLGRWPESWAVAVAASSNTLLQVLSGLINSEEFAAASVVEEPQVQTCAAPPGFADWARTRLPLDSATQRRLQRLGRWPEVAVAIFSDACLQQTLDVREVLTGKVMTIPSLQTGDDKTAGAAARDAHTPAYVRSRVAESHPLAADLWRG